MDEVQVRRCIVFGGSGTLGRAVCAALARQGARVGFTFHTGEAVAAELRATLDGVVARRADLTEAAAIGPVIEALSAELGGVDAFVHCAAVGSTVRPPAFEALAELDAAGWDRMMAVNVKSVALACQALAPKLARAPAADGSTPAPPRNVVLLGSIDGVKSVPAPVAYAASKGALSGMARALAKELGAQGVLVNVIAPGVLEAGLSFTLPDKLRAEYLKHAGLRRVGKMSEIAELVAWFALRNAYVTAQTIVVDGGL